jgi:Carboxypeptidase regulatory-like domain
MTSLVNNALIAVLVFPLVVSASCGSGPTAPMTTGVVALTGSVTSSTGVRIVGARLVILDGANAGRVTTTDSVGWYEYLGLAPSNANVRVSADGYREDAAGVYIDGRTTLSFVLDLS